MNWKGWNWLEDGLIPVAIAGLRACWLWLWLGAVRRWALPTFGPPLVPMALLAGLPLAGLAATRFTLHYERDLSRARAIVAAAGIGVLLGTLWWEGFHDQYPLWDVRWAFAAGQAFVHWTDVAAPLTISGSIVIYLWWRGIVDGGTRLTHESIWSAFATGFVALTTLVIIHGLARQPLPAQTDTIILLFFTFGMVALAISSIELSQGEGPAGQRIRVALSRYWLVNVFIVCAALIGLGLLLGVIIAPESLRILVDITNVVLNVIMLVLGFIGIVLAYIFFEIALLLYRALRPVILMIYSLLLALGFPGFDAEQGLEEQAEESARRIMNVPEPIRWLGLLLILGVIGLLFAVAVHRLRRQRALPLVEIRESILSSELLQAQLGALWLRWLSRLREWMPRPYSPFLSLAAESPGRAAIRAVYQALLAAARQAGMPRLRSQTPEAYGHRLIQRLPHAADALDTITHGYVEARYGPYAPASAQVDQVRQAWEVVRTQMQDLLPTDKMPAPEEMSDPPSH
ncbi:MAG: hypothetical protein Kow0047_15100 [Anaerolineae bacterium]